MYGIVAHRKQLLVIEPSAKMMSNVCDQRFSLTSACDSYAPISVALERPGPCLDFLPHIIFTQLWVIAPCYAVQLSTELGAELFLQPCKSQRHHFATAMCAQRLELLACAAAYSRECAHY